MDTPAVFRWEELPLERVTEMVARKVAQTPAHVVAQVYLKRGALVPRHQHGAEQLLYVLQGALACRIGDRARIIRQGEMVAVPAGVPHQAEALDDTFVMSMHAADVIGPGR